MRLPGFTAEASAIRSTAEDGTSFAAVLVNAAVPQIDCNSSEVGTCKAKALACLPLCLSGNWIGCLLCFLKDAPECLPYLPCVLPR